MTVNVNKPYCVHVFKELTSTQDYLLKNMENYTAGSVIRALTQSAGRGRMERAWRSGIGGLYFSALLDPNETAYGSLQNITQCASIGLCRVLKSLGVSGLIKWPNDVFAGGKKIAGTLSCAAQKNEKIYVVLGVGVNINQEAESLDDINGTSIYSLTGKKYDECVFLESFLNEFFVLYEDLLAKGFGCIRDEYLALFFSLGAKARLENCAQPLEGVIAGVNLKGELEINADGKILSANTGDVICLPSR